MDQTTDPWQKESLYVEYIQTEGKWPYLHEFNVSHL